MTANKMTVNGVSICAPGQENYECFEGKPGKWFFQYDYRHTDGELFTVVKPTLTECRMKRDNWLYDKLLHTSKKQEIRQNGETVLSSPDNASLPVIFRNLTGENSMTPEEYDNYIQCVALPDMGFQYGEIELVFDGVTVKTGVIRQSL